MDCAHTKQVQLAQDVVKCDVQRQINSFRPQRCDSLMVVDHTHPWNRNGIAWNWVNSAKGLV